MLTLFSIPKAVKGHVEVIQRNAIQSWLHLRPRCEIILCGDEVGVAELASEFDVKHLANLPQSEFGTPLLHAAFEQVERVARHRLICYVNADIILSSDFVPALKRILFKQFLALGQRWDLNITTPIDFGQADWETRLGQQVTDLGVLHPPAGSDYFVFPKGTLGTLPAFAVGRPGWDNWLIYRARELQVPVVDVTEVATAIHQNHDYAHVPEGRDEFSWEGPEADYNRELIGRSERIFFSIDATHRLTKKRLAKAIESPYIEQRLKRQSVLDIQGGVWNATRRKMLERLKVHRHRLPPGIWNRMVYGWSK